MEDINVHSKALNNKDRHVIKFLISKVNIKSTTLHMLQEIDMVVMTSFSFSLSRVV